MMTVNGDAPDLDARTISHAHELAARIAGAIRGHKFAATTGARRYWRRMQQLHVDNLMRTCHLPRGRTRRIFIRIRHPLTVPDTKV